jgi:hypothetical protein
LNIQSDVMKCPQEICVKQKPLFFVANNFREYLQSFASLQVTKSRWIQLGEQ